MDSNYANPGGGVGLGGIGTAAGVGSSATDRYAGSFYKDPVSCQRSSAYSGYDPYGGNVTGVRSSSVYPYDAEAEFKERTGMGKTKSGHLQMAGSTIPSNSVKQYNQNSCYGSYNQSAVGVTPESANYYAYAYDHHHYTQQQQYHQQQQYKYKVAAQQQQQQQQLQQQQQSASMKMSPPEYGYAPYHHHQHPYYHPHYHHHQQKGGVSVMKTLPDASAIPYVNSKMLHSAAMGGAAARTPQYPANYTYHPQSYPSSAGGHHHTYQSQSVCEDSRWMWNTANNSTINGTEYSNSCRSGYPSSGKQTTMWPSVPMQYQNTMSTGYPAGSAVSNQNCCQSAQSAAAANYYPPQQYTKYPTDFNGTNNDLYSNSQANPAVPPASTTAQAKVYTDLNTPQGNAYQTMNALSSMSYHQPRGDCSVSTTLDFNTRYMQQQQTDSPSSSTSSTSSSYYYHNLHPYQTYSNSGHQQPIQVDTKINLTTKSQSLRDFLTSWNEDEDECSDRAMSSSDVPFMEQLHLSAEHFTPNQECMTNPIVENHLQFKGSFTSRPKIHVGITVDSTVEADQYINLPDIIIDIEKSNKEVVSVNDTAPMPKIEKEEITIKQEKPEVEEIMEKVKDDAPLVPKKRKLSRLSRLQRIRLAKRIQLKSRKQMLRRQIRRVKNPPTALNPQSLKCLCVSLINSEKFRNRILGPSAIDSFIQSTTTTTTTTTTTSSSNEIQQISSSSKTTDPYPSSQSPSSTVIPKLSDLCKNALNSSFDRDVLVINLDEILDSDNLFVVQCDINENILENYVDELQQEPASDAETPPPLPPQQQGESSSINSVDLVEILNDNNNNSSNRIPLPPQAVHSPTTIIDTTVTPKRCCSVNEVSNLPLANAVEHNILNLTTNPLPPAPPSPNSNSCPAALCRRRRTHSHSRSRSRSLSPPTTSVSLIEQTCPTTTAGHHEPLHDVVVLYGDDDDDDDGGHHDNLSNDSDLLMLTTSIPSIHHEEIVPDNLQKFQNEKFLKYLHAKYVQGNLSQFYHANRIIKKYKRRIIKKILNIVVR